MAIPTLYRLTLTRKLVSLFRTEGKRISTKLLTFVVIPKRYANARFTIVVAKKVESSAVKRNRIKRVLQELVVANMSLFSEFEIIIYPKQQAVSSESVELEKDLQTFVSKN